jgi:predicted acetyltransferase
VDIHVLDAGYDDDVRDLWSRSFGAVSDDRWESTRGFADLVVRTGRRFGVLEDGRPVATSQIHDMAQWWHGRTVSMGGIVGVAVAPEARGRGIARELMRDVLERCAAFGHALSVLYPATAPLYRSLGWELAGAVYEATLPPEDLRVFRPETRVGLRRAGPDDAAEVAEAIRRVHREAGDCGPIDWGEDTWRIFLGRKDRFLYLAEDGFLDYHWAEGDPSLEVEKLVAGSPETQRALWAVVGSGSSTAKEVRACVAPHDPVFWLTKERGDGRRHLDRWMLRVVDAPAAIEARGYPPGVAAEVPLVIQDEQRPANAGSWRLIVKDGEGRLERAAETKSAVRVGARGLAALYAGVPTTTLRAVGLIEGDAPALDGVFAATAFALDSF